MASRGKQDRLQTIPNNPPKNEGNQNSKAAAPADELVKDGESNKIVATEADYLAVLLHQAREDKNALRQQLLAREKRLVELQTQVGILNQKILQLEIAADDKENAELRKQHDFKLGRTIHKDDVTGEVYWERAPEDK